MWGNRGFRFQRIFNFSEIPVAEEDNTFVVITRENTKERISQDGKVSSQKLDVGSNYWFFYFWKHKSDIGRQPFAN